MNTIGLSRPAWSVRGSKKFILYFSWKPMIIPFWNQWLPMIHWQWNWIFSTLYFRLTRVLSGRKLSPVITNHNSTSYNRWVLTVQNCLSSNVWLYPSKTMLKCVKRWIENISTAKQLEGPSFWYCLNQTFRWKNEFVRKLIKNVYCTNIREIAYL